MHAAEPCKIEVVLVCIAWTGQKRGQFATATVAAARARARVSPQKLSCQAGAELKVHSHCHDGLCAGVV